MNRVGIRILLIVSLSLSPIDSASYPINVWPMPRTFRWPNPGARRISCGFSVVIPDHHRHLSAAAERCRSFVLMERHRPIVSPSSAAPLNASAPLLKKLIVRVHELDAPLIHGTNESYDLTIPESGWARLTARTPWGAMRGLDTFSQLVWAHEPFELHVACGAHVSDAPKFPHRGLLLDTSRNFYPVEDLLRTIGAMGMNKLNVFHWHVTDSHSFPLALPSEPELANKGSYGSHMEYSPGDVERVVQFGFDHGVRVMPEIDSPAHTGSWGEAYPEIVTCGNKFWVGEPGAAWADRYASEPGSGQLNPLNPKTYKVLKNVIADVAALFPEPFFHAGADEVVPNCWKSDPAVAAHLSANGTLSELLEIFVNQTFPFIASLNKTAVYWEDILLDQAIRVAPESLPRETTILQTWNNGQNNTKLLTSMGYRVIVSSSEYYYLDCGHGSFTGNNPIYNDDGNADANGGSWCGPFKTWQTIYNHNILSGLSRRESRLVLGAEVALWSEQADGTVVDSRVWPRASALAESLWTGKREKNGSGGATDRLSEWRGRMVGRGVGAEPIQPLWCTRNPGLCDTLNPFQI